MNKIVLSFSFNGTHVKNAHGKRIKLNPIDHFQMLLGAIDCIDPNREHDVIVSSVFFDPFFYCNLTNRYLAEVYKRCRFFFNCPYRAEHHEGAGKSIIMSLQGAVALRADYMIHLAEDVLMDPCEIQYFVKHLQNSDYVGSYWQRSYWDKEIQWLAARGVENVETNFLNTQVFACRPKIFLDNSLIPTKAMSLEGELCKNIKDKKIRYCVGATQEYLLYYPDRRTSHGNAKFGKPLYQHEHDPINFKKLMKQKGVPLTDLSHDRIKLI